VTDLKIAGNIGWDVRRWDASIQRTGDIEDGEEVAVTNVAEVSDAYTITVFLRRGLPAMEK
jgi:hypothetical protein